MGKILILIVAVFLTAAGVLMWFANHGFHAEARWSVAIEENYLTCTTPEGQQSILNLEDLQSVSIEASQQHNQPEVYWLLQDSQADCRFLNGARGEKTVLEYLAQVPGFDLTAANKKVETLRDGRALLWQKQ